MGHGRFIFQVLYGIGSAYVLMVPLRRLPDRAAPFVALLLIATSELMVGAGDASTGMPTSLLPSRSCSPAGRYGRLIIAYPTIHWLALLLLGWSWGRRLVTAPSARTTAGRDLARAGIAALVLFAVLRGIDGYGNMRLFRDSLAPLQWLHVSKYPPSITYDALELGIMALILAAMFRLAAHRTPSPNSLFMVLGQTPMFFYLLHFPLLVQSARLLGVQSSSASAPPTWAPPPSSRSSTPSAAGTAATKRRTEPAGRVSCDPTNARSSTTSAALIALGSEFFAILSNASV